MKGKTKSRQYKSWKIKHDPQCHINQRRSSGAMDKAAAIEMFGRSVETRGHRYTTYVGDAIQRRNLKIKMAKTRKQVKTTTRKRMAKAAL